MLVLGVVSECHAPEVAAPSAFTGAPASLSRR
jgi:hypothetical protein